VNEELICSYGMFFDGLRTLQITDFTFGRNMPFQVFHSLSLLILQDGKVESVVDFHLENLSVLVIANCKFQGISTWNPNKNLQIITIRDCP
jgi:hypothetical protein